MDDYNPIKVTGTTYRKFYDSPEGNMWGTWNPEKFKVEDAAFAFITMENGATINLECSWMLHMTVPGEGDF